MCSSGEITYNNTCQCVRWCVCCVLQSVHGFFMLQEHASCCVDEMQTACNRLLRSLQQVHQRRSVRCVCTHSHKFWFKDHLGCWWSEIYSDHIPCSVFTTLYNCITANIYHWILNKMLNSKSVTLTLLLILIPIWKFKRKNRQLHKQINKIWIWNTTS